MFDHSSALSICVNVSPETSISCERSSTVAIAGIGECTKVVGSGLSTSPGGGSSVGIGIKRGKSTERSSSIPAVSAIGTNDGVLSSIAPAGAVGTEWSAISASVAFEAEAKAIAVRSAPAAIGTGESEVTSIASEGSAIAEAGTIAPRAKAIIENIDATEHVGGDKGVQTLEILLVALALGGSEVLRSGMLGRLVELGESLVGSGVLLHLIY